MNRGDGHWQAKLTSAEVRVIQQSKLETRILARHFGVCKSYIRKLRRGVARKLEYRQVK